MTPNKKGRDRGDGATPKTSADHNHTNPNSIAGWYSLGKFRTNLQQKRGWQRKGGRP